MGNCILSRTTSWGINTDKVLVSTVTNPYTATQNCWVNIYSSINVGNISINGVNIYLGQSQNWQTYIFPLMKGQTLSFGSTAQVTTMKVYAAG